MVTATPLTDGQLADRIVAAVRHGLRFADADPDSVLPETVNAVLVVVQAELDRLTVALEVAITQCAKAQDKRDKHKRSAETANAELEALRGGFRKIGGDPTQVQNLYAQLSSRGRQWEEAKAELGRVRAELATTREQSALCADCGHVGAAHSEDGERDCTASGARVTSCSCSYFIPAASPSA